MLIGNERNNLFFVGSGIPDKIRQDTLCLAAKIGETQMAAELTMYGSYAIIKRCVVNLFVRLFGYAIKNFGRYIHG